MPPDPPQIALVGHCGPDCFAMKAALRRLAPEADFVFVGDDRGFAALPEAAILLINRQLDGAFALGSGVELIASLPERRRRRAALVSNYPDAQAQAVALGAIPGFGKSELHSDKARGCMLSLLGRGE